MQQFYKKKYINPIIDKQNIMWSIIAEKVHINLKKLKKGNFAIT